MGAVIVIVKSSREPLFEALQHYTIFFRSDGGRVVKILTQKKLSSK